MSVVRHHRWSSHYPVEPRDGDRDREKVTGREEGTEGVERTEAGQLDGWIGRRS